MLLALAVGAAPVGAGAQSIGLKPDLLVFAGIAGQSNPPPQPVAVMDSASLALTWRLSNKVLAGWLSVTPPAGTAPDSLTVAVHSAGMSAGAYRDTIYVQSNDPATPVRPIPVLLVLTDVSSFGPSSAAGSIATYEVEFTFTGYTGLVEGAPDCKVNRSGYDRMVGTLTGLETTASDEDVVYVGTLRRETFIDFCETKGKSSPGDDERVWCAATLSGSAVMDVELTVNSDEGTGAFLKARARGRPLRLAVGGTCDPPEQNQIRADYPDADDGGGASPNGQPIDDTKAIGPGNKPVTFVLNGLPRLRIGTYRPDSPQGGWTLRVIRRIP
jgi:hypothetical protein